MEPYFGGSRHFSYGYGYRLANDPEKEDDCEELMAIRMVVLSGLPYSTLREAPNLRG